MPDGTPRTAKKAPCGKCSEECKAGTGIPCAFCETWFHAKCIDGMTPEFVDCCDKLMRLYGGSSFLCVVCRKLVAKLNKSFKDVEKQMSDFEQRLEKSERENKALKEKIEKMEAQTDQVKTKMGNMEKEIETGMETAKKEVKEEMTMERKEMEEKANNLVLYGLKESEKEDAKDRKEEDYEKVRKMAEEIGVEVEGKMEVKFRAGKKVENGKARPLIVRFEKDETREQLLTHARRLARKDEWRNVFVSPDLTWKQREEARQEEKKLREEADRKTEQAKNEGRTDGRYAVVGQRGRRRIVWWEDREQRE